MREDNVWNNEASRLLRTGHPDELLPLTRMLGLPIMWDSFGALEEAVGLVGAGATFRDPEGSFRLSGRAPRGVNRVRRGHGRDDDKTHRPDRSALRLLRLQRHRRHRRRRGPSAAAPSWIVPRRREGCCSTESRSLHGLAASDRVTLHPGSFLSDPLPAADCYLLSNIIHDWSDDDALTILRAVRAAAPTSHPVAVRVRHPRGSGRVRSQ